MWTYYLIAHLFLVIQNYGALANQVKTTNSSHSVAPSSISDNFLNMMPVNGSASLRSFDVAQLTVPSASVTAQESQFLLLTPNYAKVELHLGDLHGSGVIQLTSSSTVLTTGNPVLGVASAPCTPTIQNIPESILVSIQSSAARSNNTVSLAAVPTPTGPSNNTNFNIPRLSASAQQSMSGELKWKPFASPYFSVVAAAVSIPFVLLL
ncbi:uncharacterized protein SETTUDRAFT_34219 [Exserohilum turcica Et28A]|uniref:Uncharacterized protein n=1 Tax=Exserohilum turcicum (strain 28A) TaxID=671987 RepID=R0JNB4_EXST2|nr:uncharacterized protein SETTUDRAFT_34219 [Exserohilum turcica Et28A]EOA82678.1 hypothetical protein SETTUDRAFT_34219 [Exserohilum turcica Et28A]